MNYTYLPGLQVMTVDGGLETMQNPTTKSVVVIGTAAKGVAGTIYQVQDKAEAAAAFGFDGTLLRGMQEVGQYSDNIYLFRIGSKAGTLVGVGKTEDHPGL